MTEIPKSTQHEKPANQLSITELALSLSALKDIAPDLDYKLIDEATKQLERLQKLSQLIGMLAPGGTAPRTGFEQLWIQAGDNSDESPVLLELRGMLHAHWGDWRPALREAEGLPPKEKDDKKVLAEKEAEFRELLRDAFLDERENGSRAYYPESRERDASDHDATLALRVFRPLLKQLVEQGILH